MRGESGHHHKHEFVYLINLSSMGIRTTGPIRNVNPALMPPAISKKKANAK